MGTAIGRGKTVWALFSVGLLISSASSIMAPFLALYKNSTLG